jgi:putative methionine-R-sulfoxide reductase with GAF domain
MPTTNERVAVLETKMDGVTEKIDDLRDTLTESHNKLIDQLDHVREENSKEHARVMALLDDLKDFKNKWVWVGGAALTMLSLIFGHLETIIKIITH